ncbi:MAG: TetR/AcrR family transcriptional regulator [Actinomycetota bacterium]|nr:TetR/AcrR family transcriptional regulator [Actinomycetota bacterium]
MADRPTPTPTPAQRLVSATLDLVSTAGYHGAGINQVLARAGVGNGSLYHAFPEGKSELVAAAVTAEADRVTAALRAALTGGTGAAIDLLFEVAVAELEASGFGHGCRVTTVLADGSGVDAVRRAGDAALATWVGLIADRFVDDGARRDDAEATAHALVALYVGAWVCARTSRSVAPMQAAHRAARDLGRSAVAPDADRT